MKVFYICVLMTLVSVSLSHPSFKDERDKTETDIEDGRMRVPFDTSMKKKKKLLVDPFFLPNKTLVASLQDSL